MNFIPRLLTEGLVADKPGLPQCDVCDRFITVGNILYVDP